MKNISINISGTITISCEETPDPCNPCLMDAIIDEGLLYNKIIDQGIINCIKIIAKP